MYVLMLCWDFVLNFERGGGKARNCLKSCFYRKKGGKTLFGGGV